GVVEVEDDRGEGCARAAVAEVVVDADVEVLIVNGVRATAAAGVAEVARAGVEDLGAREAGLELDDRGALGGGEGAAPGVAGGGVAGLGGQGGGDGGPRHGLAAVPHDRAVELE